MIITFKRRGSNGDILDKLTEMDRLRSGSLERFVRMEVMINEILDQAKKTNGRLSIVERKVDDIEKSNDVRDGMALARKLTFRLVVATTAAVTALITIGFEFFDHLHH